MANRLKDETSPYLLQHAGNPVDWYPWGPEALRRAREVRKPIFLSIGYSACHWCHVMERESFENDDIARQLNENFVCVKVDREERPDLDHIYMNAVQLLTGHGGWPMSVFLTPELTPFFGGTYWPPQARPGVPGFDQVLAAVIDAWQNRRDQAIAQGKQLAQRIAVGLSVAGDDSELAPALLDAAEAHLKEGFDFTFGGFGGAPKFPHPMNLQFLLRCWSRKPSADVLDMVRLNLDMMARGGIYDHLGGGFARYSVDRRWLVPHFEKMLYDNALLVDVYLDAYLITRQPSYLRVVRETLDYVLRDMRDQQGAFHSTEDADSEGEEGKFYVWTRREIRDVLGPELGDLFSYVYDVTESGNFEGKNILHLPKTWEQCARIKGGDPATLQAEMEQARRALLQARGRRPRPAKDDKILASWNGLMIHSMARAGGALGEPKYVDAAAHAAEFVVHHLHREDHRLLHSWRGGRARFDAYLDDYACLANAMVTLYEATSVESWIDQAARLVDVMWHHFRDTQRGGFFYTADDHEQLIARTKELQDSAVPSGNAMAATLLLRLGKLCGRRDYLDAAADTIRLAAGLMRQYPTAAGQMLLALDLYLGPTQEVVVLGEGAAQVVQRLRSLYTPHRLLAARTAEGPESVRSPMLEPIFADKQLEGDPPAVFICHDFACQQPAHGAAALELVSALEKAASGIRE